MTENLVPVFRPRYRPGSCYVLFHLFLGGLALFPLADDVLRELHSADPFARYESAVKDRLKIFLEHRNAEDYARQPGFPVSCFCKGTEKFVEFDLFLAGEPPPQSPPGGDPHQQQADADLHASVKEFFRYDIAGLKVVLEYIFAHERTLKEWVYGDYWRRWGHLDVLLRPRPPPNVVSSAEVLTLEETDEDGGRHHQPTTLPASSSTVSRPLPFFSEFADVDLSSTTSLDPEMTLRLDVAAYQLFHENLLLHGHSALELLRVFFWMDRATPRQDAYSMLYHIQSTTMQCLPLWLLSLFVTWVDVEEVSMFRATPTNPADGSFVSIFLAFLTDVFPTVLHCFGGGGEEMRTVAESDKMRAELAERTEIMSGGRIAAKIEVPHPSGIGTTPAQSFALGPWDKAVGAGRLYTGFWAHFDRQWRRDRTAEVTEDFFMCPRGEGVDGSFLGGRVGSVFGQSGVDAGESVGERVTGSRERTLRVRVFNVPSSDGLLVGPRTRSPPEEGADSPGTRTIVVAVQFNQNDVAQARFFPTASEDQKSLWWSDLLHWPESENYWLRHFHQEHDNRTKPCSVLRTRTGRGFDSGARFVDDGNFNVQFLPHSHCYAAAVRLGGDTILSFRSPELLRRKNVDASSLAPWKCVILKCWREDEQNVRSVVSVNENAVVRARTFAGGEGYDTAGGAAGVGPPAENGSAKGGAHPVRPPPLLNTVRERVHKTLALAFSEAELRGMYSPVDASIRELRWKDFLKEGRREQVAEVLGAELVRREAAQDDSRGLEQASEGDVFPDLQGNHEIDFRDLERQFFFDRALPRHSLRMFREDVGNFMTRRAPTLKNAVYAALLNSLVDAPNDKNFELHSRFCDVDPETHQLRRQYRGDLDVYFPFQELKNVTDPAFLKDPATSPQEATSEEDNDNVVDVSSFPYCRSQEPVPAALQHHVHPVDGDEKIVEDQTKTSSDGEDASSDGSLHVHHPVSPSPNDTIACLAPVVYHHEREIMANQSNFIAPYCDDFIFFVANRSAPELFNGYPVHNLDIIADEWQHEKRPPNGMEKENAMMMESYFWWYYPSRREVLFAERSATPEVVDQDKDHDGGSGGRGGGQHQVEEYIATLTQKLCGGAARPRTITVGDKLSSTERPSTYLFVPQKEDPSVDVLRSWFVDATRSSESGIPPAQRFSDAEAETILRAILAKTEFDAVDDLIISELGTRNMSDPRVMTHISPELYRSLVLPPAVPELQSDFHAVRRADSRIFARKLCEAQVNFLLKKEKWRRSRETKMNSSAAGKTVSPSKNSFALEDGFLEGETVWQNAISSAERAIHDRVGRRSLLARRSRLRRWKDLKRAYFFWRRRFVGDDVDIEHGTMTNEEDTPRRTAEISSVIIPDWYCQIESDLYFIPENFRRFLKLRGFQPDSPEILGHVWTTISMTNFGANRVGLSTEVTQGLCVSREGLKV